MKISHKLRMKIISNFEGVSIEQYHNEVYIAGSIPIKVPLYKEIELSLDLSNDLDIFKECAKWADIITNESIIKMKTNIGPFVGLFPVEINIMKNSVTFTADEYNPNNQNWKDWFIMEEEYAP